MHKRQNEDKTPFLNQSAAPVEKEAEGFALPDELRSMLEAELVPAPPALEEVNEDVFDNEFARKLKAHLELEQQPTEPRDETVQQVTQQAMAESELQEQMRLIANEVLASLNDHAGSDSFEKKAPIVEDETSTLQTPSESKAGDSAALSASELSSNAIVTDSSLETPKLSALDTLLEEALADAAFLSKEKHEARRRADLEEERQKFLNNFENLEASLKELRSVTPLDIDSRSSKDEQPVIIETSIFKEIEESVKKELYQSASSGTQRPTTDGSIAANFEVPQEEIVAQLTRDLQQDSALSQQKLQSDEKAFSMNDVSSSPATPPLKLSNRRRKWLYITLLLLGFLATGSFFGFHWFKGSFDNAGPLAQNQVIIIKPDQSIRSIAKLLKNAGMISSEKLFIYNITHERHALDLKAGEYEIPAHASMRKIMEILIKGKSIEHSFTIPEGVTVTEVFKRLEENPLLSGKLPTKLPPEGSLLADTVTFVRGTSRQKIIDQLQKKQKDLVDAIWKSRAPNLPLKSKAQLLILASIVEKETGVASERAMIAGVFYNRLRLKMRLQSDPTVLYGLFGGKGKPSGRTIYRSDLESNTPYNTYKIKGLPPTPIAIPGKDALEATAHPAKTKALYFVADGKGGHVFSNSLQEHIARVQHWRKIKKKLEAKP